jgi:hypothetical protein
MELRYKRLHSEACIFETIFQTGESGKLLHCIQTETLKLSTWFKMQECFASTY